MRKTVMPEKDFTIWQWLLAAGTSIVGAAAAYALELSAGLKLNWRDLLIDSVPSVFFGGVTTGLCYVAGFNPILAGCFAGFAGHMAARATAQYRIKRMNEERK